ncbi:hypothetical protein [Micromonospora rhizosphaerae]|uniref:hypothetical protein n=1 Tax=Micromonospora rhizosphaerae TaxID=568872 RepID=UPI000B80FAD4|nr:hypothetical protein [Micromonospora rhizosphaerae]
MAAADPVGELAVLWRAAATLDIDELSGRLVEVARAAGSLSELPLALTVRMYLLFFSGELTAATELIEDMEMTAAAIGSTQTPFGALGLAALQGHEDDVTVLVESTLREVTPRGEGIGITTTEWATAVLYGGLGRHDVAFAAAGQGAQHLDNLAMGPWCLVELIEAAARAGSQHRRAWPCGSSRR